MFLRAGQSVTSVKTRAGEALRLHRTSVGEEVQEQLDGEEERRVEGDDGGDKEDPGQASGKGVFSAITHAVQNTVSPDIPAAGSSHYADFLLELKCLEWRLSFEKLTHSLLEITTETLEET